MRQKVVLAKNESDVGEKVSRYRTLWSKMEKKTDELVAQYCSLYFWLF